MTRRELMSLLGGAMAVARPVLAQQKAMPVIGWIHGTSPDATEPLLAAFRQGLNDTGYVEGRNVAIEYRWADGHYDRLAALAADLVGRKVNVIVTQGIPALLAAKNATATIPIIFSTGVDPVATGIVASLARPGGNLTGVSILVDELMPKRLELISELVTQAGMIALLVNPYNAGVERMMRDMQEAARAKGIQLHVLKAGAEGEFETAFAGPHPTGCGRAGRRRRCILQQPARSAGGAGGPLCRSGDL
jgi:putative tryptophan/tyrosine transport system substrate-binding protein